MNDFGSRFGVTCLRSQARHGVCSEALLKRLYLIGRSQQECSGLLPASVLEFRDIQCFDTNSSVTLLKNPGFIRCIE